MEIVNHTWHLGKAKIKRCGFKNKVNDRGKPADKTVNKKQRNLVVKLDKEAKKILFRKPNNRKYFK